MRRPRLSPRMRLSLAGLAVLGVLTACGDVSEPGTAASDTAETAGAPAAGGGGDGAFPHDQLTFVIPYGPGAGADGTGRPLGENMAEQLDVPVVFENIEGAGASVGTTEVFQAEPDGSTIGLTTDFAMSLQPKLNDDLPYSGWQDFEILLKAPAQPMIMVTRADEPYQDLSDVLEAATERPGELSIATAGSYSTSAITAQLLSEETGKEFNIVPFTGGAAEGRTALLGGRVDLGISGVSSYLGLIEAGDLRPLAIFWDEPSQLLPDLATAAEQGANVTGASNYYVVAPKGLPEDTKELLIKTAVTAAEDEDYQQLMVDQGGIPLAIPGSQAEEELRESSEKLERIMPRLEAADG